MSNNHPSTSGIHQEVNDFLIDRETRNLTDKSLAWYRNSLKVWLAFLDQNAVMSTANLTAKDLRAFLVFLKDRGHSAGGRANIFGAVRAFLRWYKDEYELTDWNPLDKVAAPKKPTEVKKPIELSDFQRMLAVCKGGKLAAVRDRALLLVLLDTGLRKQEVTDLNVGDVNLANGEIYVRSGKGGKSRTVFMGKKTRRAVTAYLRMRKGVTAESPFWATEQGDRLAYSSVRQVIRRRAEEAGIKEPGIHDFRRAFALNFLRNGGDVATLRRLLGHSNLNVVLRYLDLVKDDLQVSHGKFGPVDNL